MELNSPSGDVNIPCDMSFPDFLLRKAKTFNDKVALINDNTSESWTFSQVVEKCCHLANSFRKLGLGRGDTVVLYLYNSLEYVMTFLAAQLCGAAVAGIMRIQNMEQLTEMVCVSNPKFVFVSDQDLSKMISATNSCPYLEKIFVVGESRSAGVTNFKDLLSDDTESRSPQVDIKPQTDVALITFTSGSTGKSKGVKVSHQNLISSTLACSVGSWSLYEEGRDVTVMHRPCTHAYGYSCHLALGLYQGVTQVYRNELPGIDMEATTVLLRQIQQYKVTTLLMTPASLINLMNNPAVGQYDTSSLTDIVTAGAPLQPIVKEKVMNTLGIKQMRNVYGMSEVMMVTIDLKNRESKGVGKLIPNTKGKVLDPDTGKTLGSGEAGELWLQSPVVCLGYTHVDDQNRNSFIDGWFKTGDVVYYDDNDNLYIVDRIKDIIKYDSFSVPPGVIERVMLQYPGIAEVAVVGRPDPIYGQLATAFVSAKPSTTLVETQIVEFVKDKLEKMYWLHGGVVVLESLPKLPSGKIQKTKLREHFKQK